MLVVLAGEEEKEEDAGEVCYPHHPKGGVVVDGFGKDAAEEDTESHARIPRGEKGGVGCAALVVCGEVDEHVLISGIHVSVAQSDDESGGVEGKRMVDGGEEEIADERYEHPFGGIMDDTSATQSSGSCEA